MGRAGPAHAGRASRSTDHVGGASDVGRPASRTLASGRPLSGGAGVSRPRRGPASRGMGARDRRRDGDDRVAGQGQPARRVPRRAGPAAGRSAARSRSADRPVGDPDSAARGECHPGRDGRVPGGDDLPGRRQLPGQGRLGDGSDVADRGLALVARESHDVQADGHLFSAPACQRGVVDEPRAQAGRAVAHRSRAHTAAREGECDHPPDHERRRRAARLRSLYPDAESDAARRLSRVAGRRRHVGPVGQRFDLPGVVDPGRPLAHVAARHLPQPARLSVARMGAALLGVRRLGPEPRDAVPRLVGHARLVHPRVQLSR